MLKPLLVGLALLAAVPSAEAVSCVTTDVSAPGFSCSAGGLSFSDFAVSTSAGFTAATVGIGQVSGSSLTFQLASTPVIGPGDVLLQYTVGGGISGIDLTNNGIEPVAIGEIACKKAFPLGGTCSPSDRLAELIVGAGQTRAAAFASTDPVFIFKDIEVGVKGFISDFTNSHEAPPTPVPEPATLLLLGGSAVASGLWLRRQKR